MEKEVFPNVVELRVVDMSKVLRVLRVLKQRWSLLLKATLIW